VKWRFSVPAGCVERSIFCLFSVVLPARCVSGVSPRFHYRRHAFCFLPLAAILESKKLMEELMRETKKTFNTKRAVRRKKKNNKDLRHRK
jgi:hypothetical protein